MMPFQRWYLERYPKACGMNRWGRHRRRCRPLQTRFRDCEDWKRFRKGAWDNPWESVSLRDLVGQKLYDQVMQWNDSGALEALLVAQERKNAARQGMPRWLPKLKEDLYLATVDWESPASEEACELPQSAAHALEKENTIRETTQTSQGWIIYENPLSCGWPVKPTGWDPLEREEPQSGWESEVWRFLIPTRTVWLFETPRWEQSHNHRLHLVVEKR